MKEINFLLALINPVRFIKAYLMNRLIQFLRIYKISNSHRFTFNFVHGIQTEVVIRRNSNSSFNYF